MSGNVSCISVDFNEIYISQYVLIYCAINCSRENLESLVTLQSKGYIEPI
jgi:hypothetical protein